MPEQSRTCSVRGCFKPATILLADQPLCSGHGFERERPRGRRESEAPGALPVPVHDIHAPKPARRGDHQTMDVTRVK
jgi:hypothetical protein